MTKKPRGQATESADGLGRYVESAPQPEQRELAAAALWRGFTLGEIARKCKRDATIDSSNARRYFESKRPRVDTIETLRRVIGLTKRHVKLASGEALSEREYRQVDASLRTALAIRGAFFEDGAVPEALATFDGLDADRRKTVLNAFELQQQRVTARMVPLEQEEFGPSDSLAAFATALRHYTSFDLLKHLRHRTYSEGALWNLWIRLAIPPSGVFTEREAEAIIHVASGLLRARGIDTQPMEERLRRERAELARAEIAAKRLREE
jgi:hypothetical protein